MASEVLKSKTLRGGVDLGLSDGSWDTEEDLSQIHRGEGGTAWRQVGVTQAQAKEGWSSPQKLEEAVNGASALDCGRSRAMATPCLCTPGSRTFEKIHFCGFKPQACGDLLWLP